MDLAHQQRALRQKQRSSALKAKVLLAVFLGGAIGSVARFGVLLGIESLALTDLNQELIATAIVNLLGAWLLGIVHGIGSSKSETWKGFWGQGIAGGFTTMSGLALITAGSELGLSGGGYLYWVAVVLQLAAGVLTYWLGRMLADGSSKATASKS